MSYQSKEQSIGYILKAMIDTGSTSKEMKEVYNKLNDAIDSKQTLDNYSTYDHMIFTNRELGADDKRIKQLGLNLYYVYDVYTVEEAQGFYDAFKTILRVK